jgi:hypothetical protein
VKLTFTDVVLAPKPCGGSCYYLDRQSIPRLRNADALLSVLSFRLYRVIQMSRESQ